jgi:CheY-like chemotaxis protein
MTTSGLRKVLFAEDDDDIRALIQFSLQDVGGLEVMACASGAQALEAVASYRPDLVLLDVMMPGLSGPETLESLRRLPVMQGVPVVFLTAKAMRNEIEGLLSLGATGLIVKPFDPMTLAQDLLPFWHFGNMPTCAVEGHD